MAILCHEGCGWTGVIMEVEKLAIDKVGMGLLDDPLWRGEVIRHCDGK